VDAALGIDIVNVPDMVTAKLPALAAYQHSLAAPVPPADSFDPVAAAAGEVVFAANCASCHSGTSFSDAPNLHEPAAVGQDPAAALRSKTGLYRATPLRGLWQRAPYFHDGGAATVDDVITHYQDLLGFNLTQEARFNLAQYLLSL
jgi:cytochrome c peroxidase